MNPSVITVEIPAATQQRLAAFGTLTTRLMQAAQRELSKQADETLGYIKINKLSARGPGTLGVVTNQLRGSAYATPARLNGDTLTVSLGTPVFYAGLHEFGFQGEVSVRGHMRMTAARFAIDNGARTVSRPQASRLGLLTKKGQGRKGAATEVPGREVSVGGHQRKVNIPARAMFRTGIAERMPAMAEAIGQAMIQEGASNG